MPHQKRIANVEIRQSQERLASSDAAFVAALDSAVDAATAQTPEGAARQVAFVLAWIDGGTFAGRVELERDRYAGVRAHLLELAAVRDELRNRELVDHAHGIRARVWLADVHDLLEATRARAQAVRARTAARSRARSR